MLLSETIIVFVELKCALLPKEKKKRKKEAQEVAMVV